MNEAMWDDLDRCLDERRAQGWHEAGDGWSFGLADAGGSRPPSRDGRIELFDVDDDRSTFFGSIDDFEQALDVAERRRRGFTEVQLRVLDANDVGLSAEALQRWHDQLAAQDAVLGPDADA